MKMNLTVIIVNWNVKNFLKGCLESIYRFTRGIEFEVFVVDNNSSDGSRDMVKADFPQVRLIENSQNLGFAASNNIALKECASEYVLLLNPDTELADNSLKAMVEYMDAHAEAGCIGCKLFFGDGSLQHSCRTFPSIFTDLMDNLFLAWIFPRSTFFNSYRMGYWSHDHVREVDVPAGACLMVRYDIIRSIGFFDTRFFLYYDEIDLCRRIKNGGWKIFFVPYMKIIHYSNKSSKQIPLDIIRWMNRSKLLFFEKHYGRWSIIFLLLSLMMRGFIVWVIFPVSWLLSGRPRDNDYIKRELAIDWGEYMKFIKSRGENR
jgi:GT2 family glycosyltransferase